MRSFGERSDGNWREYSMNPVGLPMLDFLFSAGGELRERLAIFDRHDFVEFFQRRVPVFQDGFGDGALGVLLMIRNEFLELCDVPGGSYFFQLDHPQVAAGEEL